MPLGGSHVGLARVSGEDYARDSGSQTSLAPSSSSSESGTLGTRLEYQPGPCSSARRAGLLVWYIRTSSAHKGTRFGNFALGGPAGRRGHSNKGPKSWVRNRAREAMKQRKRRDGRSGRRTGFVLARSVTIINSVNMPFPSPFSFLCFDIYPSCSALYSSTRPQFNSSRLDSPIYPPGATLYQIHPNRQIHRPGTLYTYRSTPRNWLRLPYCSFMLFYSIS